MGFIIPGAAVAGYFLGQYLDRVLHLGTILSVAGAFVGTAAGIVEVLQILTRMERNADQRNSSSPDHTG
jgi:F0F1-type ATP synthase assembly protein I